MLWREGVIVINKAYSGDIVLVEYEDGTSKEYEVDMRLSDMGACDEEVDCVVIDEDNSFYDNEYTLIKKVNRYHFWKEMQGYLDKRNSNLLHDFKNGESGVTDFDNFMILVRKLIK